MALRAKNFDLQSSNDENASNFKKKMDEFNSGMEYLQKQNHDLRTSNEELKSKLAKAIKERDGYKMEIDVDLNDSAEKGKLEQSSLFHR